MSIQLLSTPTTSSASPPERPAFFRVQRDKQNSGPGPQDESRDQVNDDDFRARWWPGTEPFAKETMPS